MKGSHTPTEALYVRNFIFGVEDSLVSTVGLLSGIAIADVPRATIFLTGMVLIFVEAFSMAVGSFLSEHSSREFLTQSAAVGWPSFVAGIIMFASYFISGFIPLAPYLMLSVGVAFWVSIGFSLVALFILGLIGGGIANVSIFRSGMRMLVLGGAAVIIGVLVGTFIGI